MAGPGGAAGPGPELPRLANPAGEAHAWGTAAGLEARHMTAQATRGTAGTAKQ